MKCVGGGNNAHKIFLSQVGDENIIYKQNILFGAVHSYNEKKNCLIVNSMKSKSQDRRGDSVKKKKRKKEKSKNLNCKEVSFNNKR